MADSKAGRLQKQLGLFDVYVISTGAMFSSGFFLLPGIAAAKAGPSVGLAYLISGFLILPAMLSMAELATAMPKAGGAYYFLDRTLGPLVGNMGGIGTWIALMLKSAFALIGTGAYAAVFIDLPIKPIAVAFAAVFAIVNIVGARESSGLVRVLVLVLLTILAFFIIDGAVNIIGVGIGEVHRTRFIPFLPNGSDGLFETVGLVFVSYVGLTKVASLAEEVRNPDRNIPLGMGLSLGTVVGFYVVGVSIMVAVLGVEELSTSLTPAADAAIPLFTWLPPRSGEVLLVAAAVVAFASMSNTGILAASRYPLAMARDHLFPKRLARLGRFHTPVLSITLTCTILISFLLVLDVEAVAKLASALQLMLFGLLNVSVIVMRESHIESYDPGFRSPLYPWVQLAGIVIPLFLVAEMGWMPALFTVGVVVVSIAWYNYYARGNLERDGAIYHVFERLGRKRFAGLDQELREIIKEKGIREEDPFDEVVTHSLVLDSREPAPLDRIVREASVLLAERLPATADELVEHFERGIRMGGTPVSHGGALLHIRLPDFESSEMVLVRCSGCVTVDDEEMRRQAAKVPIRAVFLLASGEADAGRHLRILAHLAGRIEEDSFMTEWLEAGDEQALKETLLRDDRFLSLRVASDTDTEPLIGKSLNEIRLPEGTLIALIRRHGEILVPRGPTVLREGDRLTIIGAAAGIRLVAQQYTRSTRT
ncbi:MAG: amino acid permease [Gemmatimonadales bacterium]